MKKLLAVLFAFALVAGAVSTAEAVPVDIWFDVHSDPPEQSRVTIIGIDTTILSGTVHGQVDGNDWTIDSISIVGTDILGGAVHSITLELDAPSIHGIQIGNEVHFDATACGGCTNFLALFTADATGVIGQVVQLPIDEPVVFTRTDMGGFVGLSTLFSFDTVFIIPVTVEMELHLWEQGAAVPEPGTIGLMGIGLLGLGIAVSRRSRKQS